MRNPPVARAESHQSVRPYCHGFLPHSQPMKLSRLTPMLAILAASSSLIAAPLRVLVTSDLATFRDPYAAALKAAGAQVVTATEPDESKLSHADVVLIHREKFEALTVATQTALTAFTQRGG